VLEGGNIEWDGLMELIADPILAATATNRVHGNVASS
jgi:hypothetical protein